VLAALIRLGAMSARTGAEEMCGRDEDFSLRLGGLRLQSLYQKRRSPVTLAQAIAALQVPAHKANNNCVQDAQWRLRDAIKLALRGGTEADKAPSYVVKSVADLRSWLVL
jgi:hypothetical protein